MGGRRGDRTQRQEAKWVGLEPYHLEHKVPLFTSWGSLGKPPTSLGPCSFVSEMEIMLAPISWSSYKGRIYSKSSLPGT